MKNILDLIEQNKLTRQEAKDFFVSGKIKYKDLIEEIDILLSDKENKEDSIKILIECFYEHILNTINEKTIIVQNIKNDNNKYSILKSSKAFVNKFYYYFSEVYLLDIIYNENTILTDEKMTEIEKAKENFVSKVNDKLLQICDDADIQKIVNSIIEGQKVIALRKEYLSEQGIAENDIHADEVIISLNQENAFADTSIEAFLYVKSFEEEVENNFDEEKQKAYSKVYIKRRIHQFNFTKEEMYQYIIKPSYPFDEISSLVREIYQDVGYYVPVNQKNLKNLYAAYCGICEYELNKRLFLLCKANKFDSEKNSAIWEAYSFADNLKKVMDDVTFSLSSATMSKVHHNIDYYKEKITENFHNKVKTLFPDIVVVYDKIEGLYKNLQETRSKHVPDNHKNEIYDEIRRLKKEIVDFVHNEYEKEKNTKE